MEVRELQNRPNNEIKMKCSERDNKPMKRTDDSTRVSNHYKSPETKEKRDCSVQSSKERAAVSLYTGPGEIREVRPVA